MTLQHDAEAHLPWHHQAQRREVEQNVVHARRQSQAIRQVVRLAIRGDLLDVDWRRQRVKAGTRRIEETHRVPVDKPDFAVGRLGDRGPSSLEDRNQPYTIVGIKLVSSLSEAKEVPSEETRVPAGACIATLTNKAGLAAAQKEVHRKANVQKPLA